MSDTPQPEKKKLTSLALTTVDDVRTAATAFAMSGYFQDAGEASQAFTKIMAGRELGLPPIASMKDIYIVKGRVTLSARAIASLVKSSGKYDYRVKSRTDKECTIEFRERVEGKWESIGTSTFTMQMAQKAGLTKNPTWTSFPENMLFARAMTNGVGTYCPDVTHGTVYAPDELDERFGVDADGNTIAPAAPVTPAVRVTRVRTDPDPATVVKDASWETEKTELIDQVMASAARAGVSLSKVDEWLARNNAKALGDLTPDGLRSLIVQLEEKAQLAKV